MKKKIEKKLKTSWLFATLDDAVLKQLILYMSDKKMPRGEVLAMQGKPANEFIFVESGAFDNFIRIQGAQNDKPLKTLGPNDIYGEMALLYISTRTSNLRAKADSTVWLLDRDIYQTVLKDAAIKHRQSMLTFLNNASLFTTMEKKEKERIATGLSKVSIAADQTVLKQGDPPSLVYFIEEGTAIALKQPDPKKEFYEGYKFKPGDYFGELAIMKNQPQPFTVKSTSAMKALTLPKMFFKQIVYQMVDSIKRNEEKYNEFTPPAN